MRNCLVVFLGTVVLATGGCGGAADLTVAVDQVEPAAGSQLGDQRVTIRGANFLSGGATPDHVLFGEVLAETVTVVSDVELEVITPPALAEGAVDITVFNRNGFTVLADGFTYHPFPAVTAVSPNQGDRSGGEMITITGSGFQESDAGEPTVFLGDEQIFEFSVDSDTQITIETPSGTVFETEDIIVSNDNGTGSLDDGFQFVGNGLIGATAATPCTGGDQSTEIVFIDLDNGEVVELSRNDDGTTTGLAILDDGRVFGIGAQCCAGRPFFALDLFTGERTAIGLTVGSSDLATDGTTIFAMDRFGTGAYGTINPADAVFTPIGGTTMNRGALAIADDGTHFFSDNQPGAGDKTLRTVDPSDGTVSDPPLAMPGVRKASAMTFHRGTLFVVEAPGSCGIDPGFTEISSVDTTTGSVELIVTLQVAVDALESADKLIR